MSKCLMLVSVFADEGPQVLASLDNDVSTVLLDGENFAAEVNKILHSTANGTLCITNGAIFSEHWLDPCLYALDLGYDIASPFIQTAIGPRTNISKISPYAFVTTAQTLSDLGGLDERVMFGWNNLLELQLQQKDFRATYVAKSLVIPIQSPERNQRLGALYYRQLADADIVTAARNELYV